MPRGGYQMISPYEEIDPEVVITNSTPSTTFVNTFCKYFRYIRYVIFLFLGIILGALIAKPFYEKNHNQDWEHNVNTVLNTILIFAWVGITLSFFYLLFRAYKESSRVETDSSITEDSDPITTGEYVKELNDALEVFNIVKYSFMAISLSSFTIMAFVVYNK